MQRQQLIGLVGIAGAVVLVSLWARRPHPATAPATAAAPSWIPISRQTLSHGRFDPFTVYSPHGTPRGFVLLLSGAEGWTAAMEDTANRVAQLGAMVAGVDTAKLTANLEADPAPCVFPDGDLENLSHFVQAYYRLPVYLPPILAGRAAGAALAYAALAQAPANTFAAAVSLQFCPTLALRKPLCKSGALDFVAQPTTTGATLVAAPHLGNPWMVVQDPGSGCAADAARFVAQSGNAKLSLRSDVAGRDAASPGWSDEYDVAFETLITRNAPAAAAMPPQALADLPLVFVPVSSGVAASDTFAIMLSGDGGWAGLDQDVAAALTADGISVVGLDSLRYFWSARTPAGLAADIDRIIRYYSTELHAQRVALIGYSQGADVLPFAVNRLKEAEHAQVVLAAVMGMSEHALFEFHMANWIADDNSGPATLPEVDRIAGIPLLCIYGEDEADSLCPKLDPQKATVVKLKGGHHFDGDYAGLARTILAAARR